MTVTIRRRRVVLASCILLAGPAVAQKLYAPGVSDTEIKIGQTLPYSGYGIHTIYLRR